MTKLLLSLHVLAAILAIGPITVAASMFPRYAKPPALDAEGPHDHDTRTAAFLHRICRGYTIVAIAVPVFGLATGAALGVLTDAWLLASIALTGIAAAVLLVSILPGQQQLLGQQEIAAAGTGAERGAVSGAASGAGSTGSGAAGVGVADEAGIVAEVEVGAEVGTSTSTVAAQRSAAAKLAMTTGIFNLLWATVVVLMIVRPGSTTGA
ncbi:hypothetical protein [Streptomyces sp. bgisy084]|uniref:hypothetical protein n=1 Tax=unclassified Streptomyces TaxID=2593676 RepID=UPI003D733CDE